MKIIGTIQKAREPMHAGRKIASDDNSPLFSTCPSALLLRARGYPIRSVRAATIPRQATEAVLAAPEG
jgi:hypothetical protein